MAFIKLHPSHTVMTAAPRSDSPITRSAMETAFAISSCEMDRPNTVTCLLPRIVLTADRTTSPIVTVFTPPAVDPDEPPTNIRRSESTLDASVNAS